MEADLESRRYWIERVEHSKESGRWGMNTKSCYFCEYRDLCKAGWFYPEDKELIDISYRQVCGRWFRPGGSASEPLTPCALDLDHEGEHAPMLPELEQVEFEIEV